MRQVKNQYYTRRQLIDDCVRIYKKNNPEEWKNFKNQIAVRRANIVDKKYGRIKGDEHSMEGDFRIAFSFPSKLHHAIAVLLDAHQQDKLGEVKGEMRWLATNYPEFLIPNTY